MRRFFLAILMSAQALAAPIVTFGAPDLNPNGFPFNPSINFVGNMRYQAVFDASVFSAQGLVGPALLTALNFDAVTTVFSGTISNIQIFASTTSATPAGLNPTFSNNIGGDEVLVYSGSLNLSSAGGDFDVLIALQNAFTYNPALGNLLLDVRNFSGEVTALFAGIGPADTTTSRLYNNVFATTGVQAGDDALATRFTFSAVGAPEMDRRSAGQGVFYAILLLALVGRRGPVTFPE